MRAICLANGVSTAAGVVERMSTAARAVSFGNVGSVCKSATNIASAAISCIRDQYCSKKSATSRPTPSRLKAATAAEIAIWVKSPVEYVLSNSIFTSGEEKAVAVRLASVGGAVSVGGCVRSKFRGEMKMGLSSASVRISVNLAKLLRFLYLRFLDCRLPRMCCGDEDDEEDELVDVVDEADVEESEEETESESESDEDESELLFFALDFLAFLRSSVLDETGFACCAGDIVKISSAEEGWLSSWRSS